MREVGATEAIVEDDPSTREVFRTILEHKGMKVVEAVDGQQALEVVRSRHPDVVLLDLGLPIMDGRAVARELKADPSTADVPIIVVTAAAEEDTRSWAMGLGCDEFLEKPVELRTLTAAVERCLENAA